MDSKPFTIEELKEVILESRKQTEELLDARIEGLANMITDSRNELHGEIEELARNVAASFEGVNARFDGLDQRMQGMERRLDDMAQTKASKNEVGHLEERVSKVEAHVGLASQGA